MSDDPADIAKAKKICRTCAARLFCLDWRRHLPDLGGWAVYGGLTRAERRRLRYGGQPPRYGQPHPPAGGLARAPGLRS